MARVFVSHASADLTVAGEVHAWLVNAGHEVFLDQDLRDGLAVGEQWEQRLYERLRWADAMVCVLTSAYLASTWCTAEVGIARSQGSRLLPLRAEPGVIHPLLGSLQHTDLTRDPVKARAALVEALRWVDLAWPEDRCPFPGLRPFDADLHRVFFGRSEELRQLAGLLRSPAQPAVLLVVGPSGCGKSSLVRAGLGPMLAAESDWWTLRPILPGIDPVTALAQELAALARRNTLDWTVEHVCHQLTQRGLAELANELLLADPAGSQQHLLLVVDQFEELLTQTTPTDRARFTELLRSALTGPVHVVATLRPEFLDQLLLDPALAALPTCTYTLRPLRRETLRAVIEGPARLAGIELDDGLTDRLVDDTDTGEALPLLAFTLAQLAEGIRRGGRLSGTRYDQLGGVHGALTRHADMALADAVAAGGRNREQVIVELLRLVTVDEQGRPTHWRTWRDELPEDVITELNAFVARRLLTTSTDNGIVVIGVAHEAFLSAWPPLADAITANVTALRARRAVEHAAEEWNEAGRPSFRLWGRGQLAAAVADVGARFQAGPTPNGAGPRPGSERWFPQRNQRLVTDRVDLSPRARDFLRVSIRRDRYQRRRVTIILSVLLVITVILGAFSAIQTSRAQQQARLALSRSLAAQAERLVDRQSDLAQLLALASLHTAAIPEAWASVQTTISRPLHSSYQLTGHTDTVSAVAFSPDGRLLATASADHSVRIWDVATHHPLGEPLTGHTDAVWDVAFSPDGRLLATASADHSVRIWDVATHHPLGEPLTGHTDAVWDVAFSPDGRLLATASADHSVRIWDVASRQPLGQSLTGHTDIVFAVAFSPDGRLLATASADHSARIWDVASHQPLGPPLTGHTYYVVFAVAFSPNGKLLATASDDRTVQLWDVAAHHPLGEPLTGHTDGVRGVAFSPDGRLLATASADHSARLWDVATHQPVGQPLTGHTNPLLGVAFSPDGKLLATTSADHSARLWDVATRQPLGQSLTGHTDAVWGVAFSPDGRLLATASADHSARIWDVATRQALGQPLTGHTDIVFAVAFSPDGRLLATASADHSARIWDVATRQALGQPLTGHTNGIRGVAFSPDGRLLATASADHSVRIWDVATHQPLGQPLIGHTNQVLGVAFSPDGKLLATTSDDHSARIWDVATAQAVGQSLTGHTDAVWGVAFSPDGKWLATTSFDYSVRLWDVAIGQPLGPPLTGHTNPVLGVAFSPDGKLLATTSDDRSVRLWDVTTRQPVGQPLTGHTSTIWGVAFSPDGKSLATASTDRSARIWAAPGTWAYQSCDIVGRNLSQEEWDHYIGTATPYALLCTRYPSGPGADPHAPDARYPTSP